MKEKEKDYSNFNEPPEGIGYQNPLTNIIGKLKVQYPEVFNVRESGNIEIDNEIPITSNTEKTDDK